jgi:glutaconate CoA-transferase subunit B
MGSGGGNDVMSFCKRTVVVVRQSKRRFPERVDFNTCRISGWMSAGEREIGLNPNTGPAAVITDLGCYIFENGEMTLKTIHTGCGATLDKIRAEIGWDLKISPDLTDTVPPTEEEIRALREKVDTKRIWAGGKHAPPPQD